MDPDKESFDKNIFAEATSACQQAVGEAWDFTCQTVLHLDKRAKQSEVLAHGLVVGGLKDTPNELFNHTGETFAKVGITGALGACLGAAMASRLPWVKVATNAFGLLAGGTAIATSIAYLRSKPKLQQALSAVWRDDNNNEIVAAGKALAETELAREGFDIGLGVAGTAGGAVIGKSGKTFVQYFSKELAEPFEGGIKNFIPCLQAATVRTIQRELFGYSYAEYGMGIRPKLSIKPTPDEADRMKQALTCLQKLYPDAKSGAYSVVSLPGEVPFAPSRLWMNWDNDYYQLSGKQIAKFVDVCDKLDIDWLNANRLYKP